MIDRVVAEEDLERFIPTNYLYKGTHRETPLVVKECIGKYCIGILFGAKFRMAGRSGWMDNLQEVSERLKQLARGRKIKKITKKRR